MWQPTSGATDISNTLRVARSLVGTEGAVSYITDSPLPNPTPYNSSSIAIGEPIDNCGFTGVTFETNHKDLIWQATVRNYSNKEQIRSWKLETAEGSSKAKTVTLAPGSLTTLQGIFPPNQKRCRISLSTDAFQLDDSLPIVQPAPKPLLTHSTLPAGTRQLSDKMVASFPNLKVIANVSNADLIITGSETTPKDHHLIVFPQDKASTRPYLTGNIVTTKHPLTEGLNWQTLLVRNNVSIPHDADDEVLLWQGNRALIYLRTHPKSGNRALIFNFDIRQSNGMKQPALAVMMLRFCEQLRTEKVAPETRITETSEPLSLTYHSGENAEPLIYAKNSLDGLIHDNQEITKGGLNALETPGFFSILQGDTALLTAATYFADTREADFSQCASTTVSASTMATAVDRHTRDDHLWRIWICLILGAILLAWHYTKSKNRPQKISLEPN